MKKLFQQEAHVVLVSGGNTLYAVRRWKETGLDAVLTSAAQRQVVLAGGSAGAICWFTSGHSDSANPKTFLKPSILRHIGKEAEAKKEEADAVSWIYIRVPGLNILPGFLCPHYDREACDGQPPRYTDVGKMLKRHPTERCIALDHWAVLKLHGDGQFSVEGLPGKTRLDPPAEESPQPAEEIANKAPGVFILEMDNGALTRRRVPSSGVVSDLLRPASGPLVQDPFVSYFAMANPTPQSGRFVTPGS
ncbi:dipeptidase E [Angomonas deanei]|nr:dipeptidase E [Angomonas deanei]|eukprot:EPY37301.1 dipeptidase E [Angomonas deanei]